MEDTTYTHLKLNDKDFLAPEPVMEEHKSIYYCVFRTMSTAQQDEYTKKGIAYNNWLEDCILIPPENVKDFEGRTGLELGVHFEKMDSDKWFYAVCNKCGWEGSSEHLLGGGQIADTGDFGDCCCPKCESTDIDTEGMELYQGTVAIPTQQPVAEQPGEGKDSAYDILIKHIGFQGRTDDKWWLQASAKHYLETGKPTGSFVQSVLAAMEAYKNQTK